MDILSKNNTLYNPSYVWNVRILFYKNRKLFTQQIKIYSIEAMWGTVTLFIC